MASFGNAMRMNLPNLPALPCRGKGVRCTLLVAWNSQLSHAEKSRVLAASRLGAHNELIPAFWYLLDFWIDLTILHILQVSSKQLMRWTNQFCESRAFATPTYPKNRLRIV